MEVVILKLKPKGPKQAFVDFLVRFSDLAIKIKGCNCYVTGNKYLIKLPFLPIDDKNTYSPLSFERKEDAQEFFRLANIALQGVIPLQNVPKAPKIKDNAEEDIQIYRPLFICRTGCCDYSGH